MVQLCFHFSQSVIISLRQVPFKAPILSLSLVVYLSAYLLKLLVDFLMKSGLISILQRGH